MSSIFRVMRGNRFLKGISTSKIEQRLKKEPAGKPREHLQAALLYRQGYSQDYIRKTLGRGKDTISRWLRQIERDGLGAIHDGKSPGRHPKLSREQQEEAKKHLAQDPQNSGFERSNWTAKLLVRFIHDTFGVQYAQSGALALSRRMRFSVRVPRPVPHNTPSEEVIESYVSDTIKAIEHHTSAGYDISCMDGVGFADSPHSARGIRPIGGSETVKTNFHTATTKAIGALGEDQIELDFCKSISSESVINLLEKLRSKHGRIFVICDNASAHKSKMIQEYLESKRGEVVLWYLPPYTPQHNPIEVLWREIKRAIAGRYFGSFDEMHKTIRNLIKSGEVVTVKLFKYILDAIHLGKRRMPSTP